MGCRAPAHQQYPPGQSLLRPLILLGVCKAGRKKGGYRGSGLMALLLSKARTAVSQAAGSPLWAPGRTPSPQAAQFPASPSPPAETPAREPPGQGQLDPLKPAR